MMKRNGEILLLRKRKKLKNELKVDNSSKYVQEKTKMNMRKLMMPMIMMRIMIKNNILKLFRNILTRNLLRNRHSLLLKENLRNNLILPNLILKNIPMNRLRN